MARREPTYRSTRSNTKSWRAHLAEQDGRFPASKWPKILRGLGLFRGVVTADIKMAVVSTEWHHVGKYATRVDYYGLDDIFEHRRELRQTIASRREHQAAERRAKRYPHKYLSEERRREVRSQVFRRRMTAIEARRTAILRLLDEVCDIPTAARVLDEMHRLHTEAVDLLALQKIASRFEAGDKFESEYDRVNAKGRFERSGSRAATEYQADYNKVEATFSDKAEWIATLCDSIEKAVPRAKHSKWMAFFRRDYASPLTRERLRGHTGGILLDASSQRVIERFLEDLARELPYEEERANLANLSENHTLPITIDIHEALTHSISSTASLRPTATDLNAYEQCNPKPTP